MKHFKIKILIIGAFISLACTTKVSEWVLLNAPASQYTLVYFHNKQMSDLEIQHNSLIQNEIKSANIQFKTIEKKDAGKSWYGLYYGNKLFSKFIDYNNLHGLASSPLREKIASEIMSGKLCVLLYLTTGNKLMDDKGSQEIQNALADSPFKDIIHVIRLNRNDKNESHFISMLLNVEDDLKQIPEPMLFGIFGRFKALEPLVGRGINGENIKLMINFLTADCSCLIKDNLPGIDILFTNNWENPAAALVNKILDENPYLLHH